MSQLVRISSTFTNIRSTFKLGPLDIGNHASLIKRKSGKYVLLDSVKMEPAVKAQVNALTNDGKDIEAILNTHPFHTTSCAAAHETYPNAKIYGSSRHVAKLPGLPWQSDLIDSDAVKKMFSEDLDLRVPKGVDFISDNDAVHFSSVVAYHYDSKTVHVDDTFSWLSTPSLAQAIGLTEGVLALHPTLAMALEQRPGAAEDFRAWMRTLVSDWQIENICFAHKGYLENSEQKHEPINVRLEKALAAAEPVLRVHDERWGK